MEEPYKIEDEFDDYLDGNLTPAAKAAFEARLAADPALQEEFTFYQSIREGLRRSAARPQRKKELAEIRQKMLPEERKSWLWRNIGIATLLLLLVVAGVWVYWPVQEQESEPVIPEQEEPIAPMPEEDEQQQQPVVEPAPSERGQPPVAVNEDQPETNIKEDILAGNTENRDARQGEITVKKLLILDGKAEPAPDVSPVKVEIIEDDAAEMRYRFFESTLRIFTAQPEELAPGQLEITELQESGAPPRFFLKAGGRWHRILADGKARILQPETDEEILRLLGQN